MPKKTPMRMCIVCRNMFPKSDLLRIVKNDDGVFLDISGKMQGRGAYICKNPDCVAKCVKKALLDKVFDVKLSAEVYERIQNEYRSAIENQ